MKKAMIITAVLLLVLSSALAAPCDSWEDVVHIMSEAAQNGVMPSFTLSQRLMSEMKQDKNKLSLAAAKAGYRTIAWTWWTDGRVEITKAEPFGCPVTAVNDWEEMKTAVGAMRLAGETHFAILAEPSLYASLMADQAGKKALLLEAGLYSWENEYYTDGTCCLEYTSCTYWDGTLCRADSERELLSLIRELDEGGYESFAFLLDEKTFMNLLASDSVRLHALETAAFIRSGACTYYRDHHILIYRSGEESVFVPGYAILRAVRMGCEDRLPAVLGKTLRAAEKMVSGVSGTDREMSLAIHDLLCRHITYRIDDSTEDDDCCIGAILYGQANCDGYADAFLLLCGLKGIPVRLVDGDSRKVSDPFEDPGHMWNLVFLDGLWRGVDVTWDDSEDSISYENYNMGLDRMRQNYTWLTDFMPSDLVRATDLTDRPVPEYSVKSGDEVCAALREAAEMNAAKAILWMDEALYSEYRSAADPVWEWLDLAGIEGSVTYSDSSRKVIVSDIVPLDQGILVERADTAAALIAILRGADKETVKEVRIYCSDSLFSAFISDPGRIWDWLESGGVKNASVQYGTGRRIICCGEIKW